MHLTRRHLLTAGAALAAAAGCGATAGSAGAVRNPSSSERPRPARSPFDEALTALTPPPGELPTFTAADYEARQARARAQLAETGADALVLTAGPDLRYFTGVQWHLSERFFAWVLPREGDAVFVTPAFEQGRAEERALVGARFAAWQENEDPFALARAQTGGAKRIALDAACPVAFRDRLVASDVTVASAEPVTGPVRMRKDDKELALMRRANAVTLAALRLAFAHLDNGLTQDELGARLVTAQRAQGGDGVWVLPLIGPSAAFPHGTENPRSLARGDVVLVDTGCSVGGYQSDLTRTVFFGEPEPDVRAAWDLVKRAQSEALATVKPGARAGDVDAVARAVLADGGYGPGYRFFTHRLGHGIGLRGHERPYLVQGNDLPLAPGMTMSCEPGVYVPGRFGIRLEDILVVTEGGAELLGPAQAGPAPEVV